MHLAMFFAHHVNRGIGAITVPSNCKILTSANLLKYENY